MTVASTNSQRADIQGLRGIAVLAVVVYHSGLTIKGGFAGVDVFFVISGFVITQSLLREIDHQGHIELKSFYLKRTKRLLPGFLLVLATTIILSFLFFDPYQEFPEIRSAAVAGLFLSANLFFATVDSYDGLSENPLRHLWSLGVEEHFYILFPLMFYFLSRSSKANSKSLPKKIRRYLFLLLVTSLALSLFAHYLASPTASVLGFPELSQYAFERGRRFSFFLSPLRAWEILAGSLLATAQINKTGSGKRAQSLLPIAGATALALCFLFFEQPESFPGLSALAPVLATTMLLLGCPAAPVGRLLSLSPLVTLGDISYALYLWHWPIMVTVGRLFENLWISALISIPLSIALAVISTAKVENKYRHSSWRQRTIVPLIAIAPLLIGSTWFLQHSQAFVERLPRTESKLNTFAARNYCEASPGGWESSCVFGENEASTSLYLFGDSNARSASDGFALTADQNRWKLTISALSACPVNFSEVQTSPNCGRTNAERLSLLRLAPPSVLVIVNHWTNYSSFPVYGLAKQQVLSFGTTLEVLQELQIPVLVQYQIPICEFRNQLISLRFFEGSMVGGSDCLVRKDELVMRLDIGRQIQRLVNQCNQTPCAMVDLTESLCSEICRPFRNGISIFADDSHISPSASFLTAPVYESAIRKILDR